MCRLDGRVAGLRYRITDSTHGYAANLCMDMLSGLGFVRTEYRHGSNFVELAHEFLIEQILRAQYDPSADQAPRFYSCFISYSHADKAFARRLYERLSSIGIKCWLDSHKMLPGDDVYEMVDGGIRHSDKVLLCCSRNSLRSWWVDNEIDTAFAKERQLMDQRGKRYLAIIPLNLDGFLLSDDWQSGKKRPLLSRLAANFTGWAESGSKFNEEAERVVMALRADGNEERLVGGQL
jgi:hypothetical protein